MTFYILRSSPKEMRVRAPVAITESLLSPCLLLTLLREFENPAGKESTGCACLPDVPIRAYSSP